MVICLSIYTFSVMNQLNSIEELYNIYVDKKNTPRIEEIESNEMNLVDMDLEDGPVNPYLKF